MVEGVGRAINQPFAISQRHAAPRFNQLENIGLAIFARRLCTLCAYSARVAQKFVGYNRFRRRPHAAQRGFALVRAQHFIAAQEFFDLHRIVGQRFGGGIYRSQATAYHHHWQTHLHIGNGIGLGRTGQLQSHQKI